MPASLNPKPKPVFKNMVMAFAGDIEMPEAQARQYLSLRQGSYAAKFDETVTHVLATTEQFKEKGPMSKSRSADFALPVLFFWFLTFDHSKQSRALWRARRSRSFIQSGSPIACSITSYWQSRLGLTGPRARRQMARSLDRMRAAVQRERRFSRSRTTWTLVSST